MVLARMLSYSQKLKTEVARYSRNKTAFESIISLADKPLRYVSGLDEEQEIEEQAVINVLETGGIVVIRGLAQSLDLQDQLEKLSRTHFKTSLGNLSTIHEHFSIEQIVDQVSEAKKSDLALSLQCTIMNRILEPHSTRYFLELDPNVRLHLPFSCVKKHEQYIENRLGRGKLNPHGQHKDSWRAHPPKTINVWLALTAANEQNGMSILPDSMNYFPVYGDKEIDPRAKTYASQQWVTDLKPGDAVVFMADLMHGSIINHSDSTRVAFSMRCSLEPPIFHRDHVYDYIGVDNGKFDALVLKKVFGEATWLPPSRDLTYPPCDEKNTALDLLEKSDSQIKVKFEDKVLTFPRKCPHKGADLTLGELDEQGNLLCPWHRMCLKPKIE